MSITAVSQTNSPTVLKACYAWLHAGDVLFTEVTFSAGLFADPGPVDPRID
jgi:hypothetical protein